MTDDVIKIKFGVKGGASISGESGKLIKSQLNEIANKINLKIHINKDDFKKQLNSLKSEIEKTLGKLPINIRTNTSGSGGSSGSSGNGRSADYVKLKSQLQEIEKLKRTVANLDPFSKTNEIQYYNKQIEELDKNYQQLKSDSKKTITTEESGWLKSQEEQINKNINAITQLKNAQRNDNFDNSLKLKYEKIKAQAVGVLDNEKELISTQTEAADAAQKLNELLGQPLSDNYEDAKNQIENLKRVSLETETQLKNISIKNNTMANKMLDTLKNKVVQVFSYAIIGIITRALKQIYDNVIKVNSSLTQLKIVTRASQDTLKEYANSVSESAKKIGVSVTELIDSTTTFARLGYSLSDSKLFSELTAMYSKVGNTSVGDATTNLTAIIKAYKVSSKDLERVIDQLVYVGNNYAISSSEIGKIFAMYYSNVI